MFLNHHHHQCHHMICSCLNPEPQNLNPKPQTQTPNPKPQTPNPKPQTPNPTRARRRRRRKHGSACTTPAGTRSFGFRELPTYADTGTGPAERPCFLSDHIRTSAPEAGPSLGAIPEAGPSWFAMAAVNTSNGSDAVPRRARSGPEAGPSKLLYFSFTREQRPGEGPLGNTEAHIGR